MQASLELQRALVTALASDAAVSARRLPIYDGPPADARPPYLSVGQDQFTAVRWAGGHGHEHRFQVTVWDAREGLAQVKEIMGEVERAVLAMPRQLPGVRLVSLRLTRGAARKGARQWTEGLLEFRVLSVEEV